MTTAYTLHGEVGGRAGNATEGAAAEGFTITPYGNQFNASNTRTDLAGNGGRFSIGSSVHANFVPNLGSQLNSGNAFRTTFTRVSFYSEINNSSGIVIIWQPTKLGGTNAGNALWSVTIENQNLTVRTGEQTGYLVDRGTVSGFTSNMWHTLWIVARVSTDRSTNTDVPNDGYIRIFKDDPHAATTSPIFSFYGRIGYRDNFVPTNTTPSATNFQIGNRAYIDDIVCHVPSIDFISNNATMPARDTTIKYTNSSGDVVEGIITSNKQTDTDSSGNAVGVLTLTHIKLTPSGDSASGFQGMGFFGGVGRIGIYNDYEGRFGTGYVTWTDASGNTLGTGAYNYDRGRLPKDGVFMPVAKPISATATMTPSAGTSTDSFQLVDDFGGETNAGDWVYGDATGEYWHGEFDNDQSAGTDKLAVTGNPAIGRVMTYVWGKAQGAGSVVSGDICHYNVVTGQAVNTRADGHKVALSANWGLTVTEHPQAATSTPGTKESWTVENVNSASFGVYTK